jgi:glycosyltransferase involved in cell wall biosynthesis
MIPRDAARPAAIIRNADLYNSMLAWLHECRGMQANSVLECVQAIAEFASAWHTGRFCDGVIENVVLEIGERIGGAMRIAPLDPDASDPARGDRRRILHVATRVEEVGGHTRTISNWTRIDGRSRHSLALTAQGDTPIPAWLDAAIRGSGGKITDLRQQGALERACRLRTLADESADLVIMHHAGHDVVPLVAFARQDGPPVAILDHADHVFWLGSGIADLIINQREAGRRVAVERRAATRSIVLPIPLIIEPPVVSRDAARQSLGISRETLALLSIGRGMKYLPAGHHDFFRTAGRILDALPKAHLYVVGLTEDAYDRLAPQGRHPRVHCRGIVSDPTNYRMAADLYLESFPFGSATALLESAARGIPAILPYAPLTDVLVTNHGLEAILDHPATEDDYVAATLAMAVDPAARASLGDRLREHVLRNHSGEGWSRKATEAYAILDEARHRPRRIPTSYSLHSPLDLAVSTWHEGVSGRMVEGGRRPEETIRRSLFDAVYGARRNGHPSDAVRMLVTGTRCWSWDRRLARSAVKLAAQMMLRRFVDERRLFSTISAGD